MRVIRQFLMPGALGLVLPVVAGMPAQAQVALPAGLFARIAAIAADALAKSGVPSASIAVVQHGKLEQYIVSSAD